MQKWEYLTVEVLKLDYIKLSEHGSKGWELVGFVPNVSENGVTYSFTCIFKRPVDTA